MQIISRSTVFEARTWGYHIYRIPCLAATSKGTLIASAEARRGVGGDWDSSDIVLRRSHDRGEHWEGMIVLASDQDYGPGAMNNCVMITDQAAGNSDEELVHVLFCHNYARVFYTRSRDGGETFDSPREITTVIESYRSTYSWRVAATGPGHGVQLSSGRLLVPLWMSEGSGDEFGPGKLGHRPSVVATIYSDDHGETWQTGEIVVRDGDRSSDGREIANPSEAVAVETQHAASQYAASQYAASQYAASQYAASLRGDGGVYLNIRSESTALRRLVTTSPSGIGDWQTPWFDEGLLEPICMASLAAMTDPHHLVFANPDNLENTLGQQWLAFDRKRLTAQVSEDNGKTWSSKLIIEKGPAGYSDMAVLPGGEIGILYECGMIEHMADTRSIAFTRFT